MSGATAPVVVFAPSTGGWIPCGAFLCLGVLPSMAEHDKHAGQVDLRFVGERIGFNSGTDPQSNKRSGDLIMGQKIATLVAAAFLAPAMCCSAFADCGKEGCKSGDGERKCKCEKCECKKDENGKCKCEKGCVKDEKKS